MLQEPTLDDIETLTSTSVWGKFVNILQTSRDGTVRTFDEIEQLVNEDGSELLRLIVQDFIDIQGNGDVGDAVQLEGGTVLSHKKERTVTKKVRWGPVTITSMTYSLKGNGIVVNPNAERLQLPSGMFSYGKKKMAVNWSTEMAYDRTSKAIEENTSITMSKGTVENLLTDAAQHFDVFAETRQAKPDEEKSTMIVSSDRSKVTLKRSPEESQERKKQRKEDGRAEHQLGKGEKPSKGKMALVGAVYTSEPFHRTPEEVVEELMPGKKRWKNRPEQFNKKVYASLTDEVGPFHENLVEDMCRRDPEGKRVTGGLVDGELALMAGMIAMIALAFPNILLILDLFHVMSYLRKASYCNHEEGSDESEQWVKARLLRLLRGEVAGVIHGLRISATKRRKRKKKWAALMKAADYMYARRKFMRYDEALRLGLPIATGVIEGAGRHLIKDRMARTGMRWSIIGGNNMLKVRSLVINEEFDDFWRLHVELEQKQLWSVSWVPVPRFDRRIPSLASSMALGSGHQPALA